jgi:hypothetical protein
MPRAVAKAKKKSDRPSLAIQSARADERYAYALPIKEMQDDATKAAINRLVAQMAHMATPVIDEDATTLAFKKSIQYKTQTYIAVRLLVACAKWDIRIANFKLPKSKCADCGKKV